MNTGEDEIFIATGTQTSCSCLPFKCVLNFASEWLNITVGDCQDSTWKQGETMNMKKKRLI
jgi:hypothetical protein